MNDKPAGASPVDAGVGRHEPERVEERMLDFHGFGDYDFDDFDDPDYHFDESDEPEFGCCLPPGECCMPGLHFPSECHTAADYEREQFGGWASDAGPRKPPNVALSRAARR